jgi:hypothetical protein
MVEHPRAIATPPFTPRAAVAPATTATMAMPAAMAAFMGAIAPLRAAANPATAEAVSQTHEPHF